MISTPPRSIALQIYILSLSLSLSTLAGFLSNSRESVLAREHEEVKREAKDTPRELQSEYGGTHATVRRRSK